MLKICLNIPHVKLQFATKFEMNLTNSSYFSELPKGWHYVIKQWQCSPKAQSVNKVKGKDIDDSAWSLVAAWKSLNQFFAEAKHLPLLKHIKSNIFAKVKPLPLEKTH